MDTVKAIQWDGTGTSYVKCCQFMGMDLDLITANWAVNKKEILVHNIVSDNTVHAGDWILEALPGRYFVFSDYEYKLFVADDPDVEVIN